MDQSEFAATTTPFQLSTAVSNYGARVASLSNGNLVTLWPVDVSNETEIRARLFDSNGTAIGSEFIIGDIENGTPWREDGWFEVVALSDGGFVTTWAREDGYGTDLGVFAARYNALGNQVGASTRIDTVDGFYEYDTSITALSGGGFAITWSRHGADATGDNDVHLRLLSSNLTPLGAEILVNQYVDNSQNNANVAQLENGNIVVTWRNLNDPDGTVHAIYARLFDTSGQPVTDEFRVNPGVSGSSYSEVVPLASGGFLVAWQIYGTATVAQRFDNAGNALGDLLTLSADGAHRRPVIVGLQDGGFVLMTRVGTTYDNDGVVLQRFDDDGVRIGGEHVVVADNGPIFENPLGLVQGADGALVATWTAGSSNIRNPAFAQVFRLNTAPEGQVDIEGAFDQGQTLTAMARITDADGMVSSVLTYQWLRDGVAIDGALGESYTLVQADVGHAVSALVSFTDDLGTAESLESASGTVANVNDPVQGEVAIDGDPIEGQVIYANISGLQDADGLGRFSFQWFMNGEEIPTQITVGLRLEQDHVGQNLTVQASFTDGGGSFETVTSEVITVANLNDLPQGIVVLSGDAVEDRELRADVSGITDQDGLGPFSYQWLSNGGEISGAVGAGFTLGDDDSGRQISVRVTYTDGFGTEETIDSAATTIANVNDLPTGVPVLEGAAAVGFDLRADTSLISDLDGVGTFSFQWLRDGQEISGATGQSYVPVLEDLDSGLSVRVQYTDGHGSRETLTSSAQTVTVVNTAPTGAPYIEGEARVGETLTGRVERIADPDSISSSFSYSWFRNDVVISGETSATYVVSPNDENQEISLEASYVDGFGFTETLSSAPIGILETLDASDLSEPIWIGSEIRVNTEQRNSQYHHSLAPLEDGGFVAAWQSWAQDGSIEGVYMQRFSASGVPLGYETRVNADTVGNQTRPEVAGLSDGGFVVVFQTESNTFDASVQNGIFAQRYDASGNAIGGNVEISGVERNQYASVHVSATENAGFAVVWIDHELRGAQQAVEVRVFEGTDSNAAASFRIAHQVNDANLGFEFPRIATLTDGNFAAVWVNNSDVRGQIFSPSGARVGEEFAVIIPSGSYPIYEEVEITALTNGGFVALWASGSSADNVRGRVYNSDGTAARDAFIVDASSADQHNPSAAALPGGGFVVAWEESVPGAGQGWYSRFQVFDERGVAISQVHEAPVSDHYGGPYVDPVVIALANDWLVIAQTDWDDSSIGVNAQFVSILGTPPALPTLGADTLDGTSNADQIDGLAGNDTINGYAGNDSLVGNLGNDDLSGGQGNDTVSGNEGRDTVNGGSGNDNVAGGPDDDTVFTGSGNDSAGGGAGNDTITVDFAETGDLNQIWAGPGNDFVRGNLSRERVDGGDGSDTLVGNGGNDTLIGGTSSDDRRDVIYGGDGNDSIDGGYGNDELRGDAGNDTIAGGFGADTVIGGTGDDTLTGSAFADQVFGGDGDDFINGGFGHDLVNGGADADRFFHIGIADHGSDWIQDYDAAEGDILQFGIASATRSQFQVNTTHTATAAGERSGDDNVEEAFVIYRPTGQIMWALVDGAGQASINLQIGGEVFDLLA
ncbi:calcium-binding protein [Shimia thalassica]|uniref:calcium-binding protein n=1 Tax=Shimia thalassica TaxID=1715693 RepID=UPI0026E322A7|nr:hypothetical protein [Shimia thalassica]MDO6482733.1 hypothetical protein [Shimia thalassica]